MSRCANCSADVRDAYCSECGQRAAPPPTDVRGFGRYLVSTTLGLESRLLRTLRGLMFRPGFLTKSWLDGHRVRYTDPLQIYLLAAGAFFLVHAYRPLVQFDVATRSADSRLGGASAQGGLSAATLERLIADGTTLEVFAERFDAWVSGYMPVLLVAIIAVFTGVVWTLNVRSGRPFAAHAIFALHWSAFYLLTRGFRRLLPLEGGWETGTDAALILISGAYLAVAFRIVYGGGWIASAAKSVASVIAFGALIAVWLASAIGLAVHFA